MGGCEGGLLYGLAFTFTVPTLLHRYELALLVRDGIGILIGNRFAMHYTVDFQPCGIDMIEGYFHPAPIAESLSP